MTLALDASIRQMDEALTVFGSISCASADVALVFYAGHALQYQGKNYLMPIDASLNDEIDLRRSMVDDEQIRIALDRSSGVKILILDACRNNPLADRFTQKAFGRTRAVEATRGLARIDKAQGMVIAYAAEPGKVAFDANTTGKNSPFTTALLRRMQEPALEISTMLRRVATTCGTRPGAGSGRNTGARSSAIISSIRWPTSTNGIASTRASISPSCGNSSTSFRVRATCWTRNAVWRSSPARAATVTTTLACDRERMGKPIASAPNLPAREQ